MNKNNGIDTNKLLHDLRSLLGVFKTLRTLATRRGDRSEQELELHALAIEKLEALVSEIEAS